MLEEQRRQNDKGASKAHCEESHIAAASLRTSEKALASCGGQVQRLPERVPCGFVC